MQCIGLISVENISTKYKNEKPDFLVQQENYLYVDKETVSQR